MATPTLILGANNWAIEEDNILGYALGSSSNQYLPREISFTRGSDATYTDSTGVVRQACWNLLSYSEEFDNAIWTKAATSITANSTTSPNGSTGADTITADGTTSLHRLGVGLSITTGTNYTLSIYAKKNTNNFIQIVGGFDAFGSNVWANFDLNIGVVGSVGSSTTASIVNIGDGWYRCILTGLSTATTTVLPYQIVLISSATSLRAETNNLSTSVFIWGAQIVQGSDPLPYLRTTDRLNVPRVDSSTGTKAFLVEPQRTNLLVQSNTFTTSWAMFTGPAVTPNSTTSPEGSTNATTLNSSGGVNDFLYQTLSGLTIGTTYTFSFYIKNLNSSASRAWGPTASTSMADISWSGSTLVSISGSGNSFTSVGNGWYRVVLTGAAATATPSMRIYADVNNTSKSVYIYGAQFEAGAYPSTYIPTQATTVTRIADIFSKSNIYTNGYIGQTGGTWFVELRNNIAYTRDSSGFIGIGDTSALVTNSLVIFCPPTSSRLQIAKFISTVGTTFYTTTTDTVKIAIKWNGSTADVFANGTKVVSATVFTTTVMEFLQSSIQVPAFIQQMKLYSAPLDDAECISITTL